MTDLYDHYHLVYTYGRRTVLYPARKDCRSELQKYRCAKILSAWESNPAFARIHMTSACTNRYTSKEMIVLMIP